MTEAERKELYECSIKGFLKEFYNNNYGSIEEAINGAVMYIAKHGMDYQLTTCQSYELLYVAKNEIAKMVAKKQIDNEIKDLTDMQYENEKLTKLFFTDPIKVVSTILEKSDLEGLKGKENDPEYKKYLSDLKKNVDNKVKTFNSPGFKTMYDSFEKNQADLYEKDVMLASIESKLPDRSIDESFKRQKPGFFEKIFRRTSNEYKEFKRQYDAYKTKKGGFISKDSNALKDSAMAYLRHKFPNMEDGELPSLHDISSLSGAGKERALFCLNVVESIKNDQEYQAQADKMIKAVKDLNLQMPDVNENKAEVDNFQKEIGEKVEDKIININEINFDKNENNIEDNIIKND